MPSFRGAPAEAEIEILMWSDLVKSSMERGVLGTYWLLLRAIWVFGVSGALLHLLRLRKGPMIAALYPAVLLVAQALVALVTGFFTDFSYWMLETYDALGVPLPG